MQIADQKVDHVHAGDPNGKFRDRATRRRRIVAGKLADHAVKGVIELAARNSKARVVEYDDIRTDNFRERDQFDLQIEYSDGAKKRIEVRSSFLYRIPCIDRAIHKPKISILGWYATENKPEEERSSYYFQVFFHRRPKDIAYDGRWPGDIPEFVGETADERVVAYIVGGATRACLEERGENAIDPAEGAEYRLIRPVTKGMQVRELLNAVVNAT